MEHRPITQTTALLTACTQPCDRKLDTKSEKTGSSNITRHGPPPLPPAPVTSSHSCTCQCNTDHPSTADSLSCQQHALRNIGPAVFMSDQLRHYEVLSIVLSCAQIPAGILQASADGCLCIASLPGLVHAFTGAIYRILLRSYHAFAQSLCADTSQHTSTALHVLHLKSLWLKVPSGAVESLCHCCSACLLPHRWIPAKNSCAFSCRSLPCCHGFGGVLLTGAATFQPCHSQYRLKTGTASTLTAVSGPIRCYSS